MKSRISIPRSIRKSYKEQSLLLKHRVIKPINTTITNDTNLIIANEGLLTANDEPRYIFTDDGNETTIPRLKHGLERVLFNPGIHYLKDPRTGVYNYDPYLRFIMKPENFNFNKVSAFIPPSEDEKLHKLANENSVRFVGSTSSTSNILSLTYMFISNFAGISLNSMPKHYQGLNSDFTKSSRSPQMVTLKPSSFGKFHTVSYFNPTDRETVLSQIGTLLEHFLTKDKDLFNKLTKFYDGYDDINDTGDHYAYCHYGDFLLRSQLDCHNTHLPRKRFDIKTRGTAAIRYNIDHFNQFIDYRIHRYHGKFNSYAKEYYDMMRSVFLKYQFQVRIGNMDGIFVAYHNTEEIFGFQYIPLEEMDDVLFGCSSAGRQYFQLSIKMLSQVMNKIVDMWPGEYIRVMFSPGTNDMRVYAERLDEYGGDEGFEANSLTQDNLKAWSLVTDRIVNGEISNGNDLLSYRDTVDISYRISQLTEAPLDDYKEKRKKYVEKFKGKTSSNEENMLKFFSRYFSPLDRSEPIINS